MFVGEDMLDLRDWLRASGYAANLVRGRLLVSACRCAFTVEAGGRGFTVRRLASGAYCSCHDGHDVWAALRLWGAVA